MNRSSIQIPEMNIRIHNFLHLVEIGYYDNFGKSIQLDPTSHLPRWDLNPKSNGRREFKHLNFTIWVRFNWQLFFVIYWSLTK